MNWIEKMIVEQCPKGVGASLLGSCSSIIRGNRVTKGQIKEIGRFPVISGGVTPMGFLDEYNRDENTITISQYGTAGYVDFQLTKFWANDICYSVYPDEVLNNRFLYYYLKNKQEFLYSIRNTNATPYSMPIETLKNLEIPLPPLSIQKEIVRVLDKFSELIEKTDEEIALRQKQYEYYREKLLIFDEKVKNVKLGDVCDFVRGPFGGSLKKEIFVKEGYAVYEQQHAIYNRFDFRYFITEAKYNSMLRFKVSPGDIIMSCSGTMGKTAIIPENSREGVINQALLKITPHKEINRFFLKSLLDSVYFMNKIADNSGGGAIQNVASVSIIKDIEIPLPLLSIQEEIVSVLDKFETLISKLKEERELRQKQYEYYREKLLTF